ncbi:Bax inhibitor-1/YccA family protein [Acholeplasma laidlawii]|uniref:Bax inhibitor-1/YccA family protein n=1 Tax=Acholeplasma laidlawii TaxID=2148 RepID=UPI0018C2B8B4|nr:Bax inhibitor-1/YccA family protein [Acholeplasma laidlawii]MBG0762508.1 Bax inhibitor-1/YccA family protein [Acholeplasma laidlawii]
MRSSNPVFTSLEKQAFTDNVEVATKSGITLKTITLVVISLITGFASIFLAQVMPEGLLFGILIGSGIFAFISVLLAMFVPKLAASMSILYAVLQGFTYGLLTWVLEMYFPGVASIALLGTALVFGVMFTLYNTGLLRGSNLLRSVVFGALLTVLVGSLIVGIVGLVNPEYINGFFSYEVTIAISLILIVMGALMLTLDFDRAESVVRMGLPKHYEWTVALGFMVTLIWIYYNILRLAVTVMGRNNN